MTRPAAVEVSPAAARDLDAIADHVANEAEAHVAGRWVARLRSRIAGLADFPLAGVEDGPLGPGRRRLVERPYLIIYRVVREDLVRVIRIVHGARELPTLLSDGP